MPEGTGEWRHRGGTSMCKGRTAEGMDLLKKRDSERRAGVVMTTSERTGMNTR